METHPHGNKLNLSSVLARTRPPPQNNVEGMATEAMDEKIKIPWELAPNIV